MIRGKSSKGWRAKLEQPMQPKLIPVPDKWAQKIGDGMMLIPTPLLVDAVVNKIPRGKVATVNNIREYLADKYEADLTCPLTTGIFLNIAANAAEEDKAAGKTTITPYWRVLKQGGFLNPKFPGGVRQQAALLHKEGFKIVVGNKEDQLSVKDYEDNIAIL